MRKKKNFVNIFLVLALAVLVCGCSKSTGEKSETLEEQKLDSGDRKELEEAGTKEKEDFKESSADMEEHGASEEKIESYHNSSAENDTDLGLKNIKIDYAQGELSDEQKKIVEYFSRDYMFVNSGEALQRYNNIFDNSLIQCYVNVAKVISYEGNDYELLVYIIENSNEIYSEEYADESRYMIIKGTTEDSRFILGDNLLIEGRYKGVISETIDGVSLSVPEIDVHGGYVLQENDAWYYYPSRFSMIEVKNIAKSIFGEDITISEPDPNIDVIDSVIPYYVCTLDNQSNAKFSRYYFSEREGTIIDAEHGYGIEFAAEVKDTANANVEKILSGDSTRKIRHDDLPDTLANHPLFDHVEIDADGNIIDGSGTQMKFIGATEMDPTGAGNAERALKKLLSKDFQKYIDHDVKIEVPKDEYQQMMDMATEEIDLLHMQLEKVVASGNAEAAAKIEKKIENLNKLKRNLRPATLTRKESLEAVDSPKLSTAKSVVKLSHKAGIKTAETAALIGGSASLVRNIVGLCKEEVEADEAAKNIVKDTAQSAAVGYSTGFVGSAIKGRMQNSSSEYTRTLAKTNVAGTIAAVTVSASETLKKYFSGEIDGTQCMESLGEQGIGMIASSMFTLIGQTVIPIPIVGGAIGGMVGYALSSATYGILTSSLKEAKLAREERIAIEKACEEHIQMIREYRTQMNAIIEKYLSDTMEVFYESFAGIKSALAIGDVDYVIESANDIIDTLGGNKPFETMDDFNEKMLSGVTFKI